MEKILISACFLGERVRYDGNSKRLPQQIIAQWQQQQRLVMMCPEVAGGLSVPRPPAEIQPDGRIVTSNGDDVTPAFERGAQTALKICQRFNIRFALLKASSPSCGSDDIYDGSFSGVKIAGQGVTANVLQQHGIAVYSEHTLDKLITAIAKTERD